MPDFLIIAITVAIVIAFLFKTTWILLWAAFKRSLSVARVLVIVGLLMTLSASRQLYEWAGWTPLVPLLGRDYYEKQVADHKRSEQNQWEYGVQPDGTILNENKARATDTRAEPVPKHQHRGFAKGVTATRD